MSDDLISRQAAIEVLAFGKEMLGRVLDDMDVVGTDREKYSWGLVLIESYIYDIEELPSAQPERGYIEQIKWERDLAIRQLADLGYSLGEKPRTNGDLISRQAAVSLAKDLCVPTKDGTVYRHRCIDPDQIRELPSVERTFENLDEVIARHEEIGYEHGWKDGYAQAVTEKEPERKKGRWINHRNDNGHNIADCSECGNAIQWFDDDEKPKFCCMCGADMRGEQ